MSWLPKQLTKSKQNSPMWLGFAEALEEIYSSHIQPLVDRVASMNSVFSMSNEDLQRKLDELGTFFYMTKNIDNEDLPLALMQKLDEVHFKRTDLPLKNTISREFGGLPVEWAALYAPKLITPIGSKDYTTKRVNGQQVNALRTEYEIKASQENINDYFMTSRGVIQVSLTGMALLKLSQDEFSKLIERIIKPIIPTEIVYAGEQILIHYDIIEPIERFIFGYDAVNQAFNAMIEASELMSEKNKVIDNPLWNNAIEGEPENHIIRLDLLCLDAWPLDLR